MWGSVIHEYLCTGERNAITGRELGKILQLEPRQISIAVEQERRDGHPICATCSNTNPGYYLAENQAEMLRYCDSLHHRAGEIYKTRDACMKTLDSLPR